MSRWWEPRRGRAGRKATLSCLAREPANRKATGPLREAKRVGVANPAVDETVGARHQPAEIPRAAPVTHRYVWPNANHRPRSGAEQLAFGAVIARAGMDEDGMVLLAVVPWVRPTSEPKEMRLLSITLNEPLAACFGPKAQVWVG